MGFSRPGGKDICLKQGHVTRYIVLISESAHTSTDHTRQKKDANTVFLGCTPQRKILEYKYRSDPKFSNQIWTQDQLLTSTYPLGTELMNHFNVVDRPDASTIVFRCGDSPLENPESPRSNDGLFEMEATVKQEEGFAEFRLKSVFYQGEGRTEKAPFEGEVVMPWAHRAYAKLWMEVAVGRCRRSLMGDIDWEKVKWGETKKN